ncbi:MAG: hydroxymethylbilane synthase [Planctomycetales bacterium]|nr:hydroxymethylbilane synthase [Planctomycetales bacterium]NIM07787.1 hydroxymethylbilane synthase [Planctomycetales bacterium]NIN07281.1 hydroxymethylbilane synthase [Planctomycetales bacterium]NIN76373.1 hydroxymethylbilane synthase [Planctomycetales bacterium]NIO33582.1 hydroxymethylbilane synthase [Planctomycetales bacterium]
MPTASPIRIGTRGSSLARWQAKWVAQQFNALDLATELVVVETLGDRQSGPIASLDARGVFTKSIQRALLDERIDLAVHSLKDLPTEPVPGLGLACVPPRESCADALVGRDGLHVQQLPAGCLVGTGSIRRAAQLKHWRADLQLHDIRGNVETRLEKLDAGQYDALVLAEAGLLRLGLARRITQVLPPDKMLPAVGQGALGLEARVDDRHVITAASALDDPATHRAVVAERALLNALRGGCLAPVGAWARMTEQHMLLLDAVVLDPTGQERIAVTLSGPSADGAALGVRAAEQLLSQGAADLIDTARRS